MHEKNNMDKEQLKSTIKNFLHLIDVGSNSVQQNEQSLKVYLDKIALAASEAVIDFGYGDYMGGSSENEKDLRKLICLRFPNYGYYNIPNSISKEIANTAVAVGDGIDDLMDITKELRSINNLWEQEGSEKALPSFQAAYKYHLGDHLRRFQYYLNALEKNK